jgi:release factor glutamine methyltransferase
VARTDELSPEIKEYEPESALYTEEGGLAFYRRLSQECKDILTEQGQILLELGIGQRASVQELFTQAGWTFVKAWRDLAAIDRVIAFRR